MISYYVLEMEYWHMYMHMTAVQERNIFLMEIWFSWTKIKYIISTVYSMG